MRLTEICEDMIANHEEKLLDLLVSHASDDSEASSMEFQETVCGPDAADYCIAD
jgi:hypothetical protein